MEKEKKLCYQLDSNLRPLEHHSAPYLLSCDFQSNVAQVFSTPSTHFAEQMEARTNSQ